MVLTLITTISLPQNQVYHFPKMYIIFSENDIPRPCVVRNRPIALSQDSKSLVQLTRVE